MQPHSGCGNQYPIVPGTNPALQTWNGQAFVVADGSAQNPISLPFLKTTQGGATYFLGADNNGNWSYYNPTNVTNANSLEVTATGSTTARTLENRFADVVNVKDFGAVGDGVADDTAAFTLAGSTSANVEVLVPSGTYLLTTSPSPTGNVTWMVQKGVSFTGAGTIWSASKKIVSRGNFRSIESDPSFYNGIFGYLEQNAAQKHYGTIGCHGSVRTSGGNGSAGEADIGVSGFAVNDLVGGLGGAWSLYGTAIRQSGVNGPTHGLELEIANMGNTVPLFPAQMGASGQTHALWLGTGGEATNVANVGTASVAIGIIRNDVNASPSASFQKGIVFQNVAIDGCAGTPTAGTLTGTGSAIALAAGHRQDWYNNSNGLTATIYSSNTNSASANVIELGNGITRFTQSINCDGQISCGSSLANSKIQLVPDQGAGGTVGYIRVGHSSGAANGTNYIDFTYNGSTIAAITQATTSSVSYLTSSDYRLKNNIEKLTDALARLEKIPVHKFNWKADPTSHKVDGFIAHEVQVIVPEAIHGEKDAVDENGNPIFQGIDQSKLVPLLTASVQELSKKNESLASVVNQLLERIEALESR